MNIRKSALAIIWLLVLGALLRAETTKVDAKNLIISQVLVNELDNVNVYGEANEFSGDTYKLNPYKSLTVPYADYWVFFVDDNPLANWEHPCRYIFVNTDSGNYIVVSEKVPLLNYSSKLEEVSINVVFESVNYDYGYPATITPTQPDPHKFAILLSGETEPRHWNDLSAMYCTLKEVYGYTDDNMIVLSHNGAVDPAHNRSLDLDPHNDDVDDIDGACTYLNVENAFKTMDIRLSSDDVLFVYVNDHGGTHDYSNDSYICLYEWYSLEDEQLAGMVAPISCSEIIYVMEQCYSGGFKGELDGEHVTFHSATDGAHSSWGGTGVASGFDEFVYYWTSATRGYFPLSYSQPWKPSSFKVGDNPYLIYDFNPDESSHGGNGDGFIQMQEAFEYANYMDLSSLYGECYSSREFPQEYNNIGFTEDLLSLNGLCGRISASKTVNGNFLIQPDLTIDNGSTFTLSKPTTPYELSHLTLGEFSNLSVAGSSFLNITDMTQLNLKGGSTLTLSDLSNLGLSLNSVIELEDNSKIALQENSSMNCSKSFNLSSNPIFSISENSTINFFKGLSIGSGAILSLEGKGSVNAYSANFSRNSVIQGDGNTRLCLFSRTEDLDPFGLDAYGFTIKDIIFEGYGFLPMNVYSTSEFINTKVSLFDQSAFLLVGNSDTALTFSNNSELLVVNSTLIGMYNNVINFVDGSKFLGSSNADISGISFNIEDWGIFNYSNNCNFRESSINVSNSGILNFPTGGTYMPSLAINARLGGQVVLSDNAILILNSTNLNMEAGSSLSINQGSSLKGSYSFPASTKLKTKGDCSIEGNFTFSLNASMSIGGMIIGNLHPNTVIKSGSDITFNQANLYIGQGAEVMIEEGAVLRLNGPMKVVLGNGAKINYDGIIEGDYVEWIYGYEEFIPDPRKSDEFWEGLYANPGSHISISNSTFSGVATAISGTPASISITNCTFTDCTNGINLVGCNNYIIEDNTLTGIDEGCGISITSSDGVISRNVITHFNFGAYFVMSSPVVSKCEISYNKYYGIVISGHDALPSLINTEIQPIGSLNCIIEKNGYVSNNFLFPSAQIGIIPVGSVYMRYNDVISSPNFYGISIAQKDIRDQYILIDAKFNYWGTDIVTPDYFFGHPNYTIDYAWPYPRSLAIDDPASNSLNRYVTEESRILINAINLEAKDKLTPAINLFEHIIKKYVDTPEYYVALARLPYLYDKAELDNNVLIATYDEAFASDKTSHKKFFKGKKVATHIKGQRYDAAIAVAEEMKSEADFVEEIILADINIAIANLLKESEGKGKSGVDYSSNLQDLLLKLNGKEEGKEEPAGRITENVLPLEHTLYQNYPNPFNPVTQIKFDLAKTVNIKLSVYNVNGQVVAELASGVLNAGNHSVDFDGSKMNSGVYYYTLEADGIAITKKMILMK